MTQRWVCATIILVIKMKHSKPFIFNGHIYCLVSVIYMELVLRAFTVDKFFGWGILIGSAFSVLPAALSVIFSRLFGRTAGKISTIVLLSVIFVLFATQTVYQGFFGKYMILNSVFSGGAAQITEGGMIENTFDAIVKGIPAIILLALPIVLLVVFREKICFLNKKPIKALMPAGASIVLSISLSGIISLVPALASVRSGSFDLNLAVGKFGMLYSQYLDIKYNIFGAEQQLEISETVNPNELDPPGSKEEPDPEIDTSPNVMDIDFAGLAESEKDKTLKTISTYFSGVAPTNKNEYTGMYKDYNLISITAEGFSPYAYELYPELTPTLNKMSKEGFKFTNFYTPIWGVSTSDGEYAHCTGLIPKSGVWSFKTSGANHMPFTLGNMFRSIGVKNTFAYHNHTYTYYGRDISHPNMGYTYKGWGNGLEKYIKKVWPESDLEMIQCTTDDYLKSGEPFHAYYMTVSGHLNYTKIGNMMASKHWDKVKNLDCSEEIKAYVACNIEFDLAMEELLKRLNDAGVADKTVIVITPDHYPYGLETSGDKYRLWREMYAIQGKNESEFDSAFELYRSSFILYCQGTKDAPTVDKYCEAIDILPTVLNLFGFEYDSRLLMGEDVLSTSSQLVIFSDRSFITERGKYNSKTGEFTLFHGVDDFQNEEAKKRYINSYKEIINNKFQISAKILDTDYYRYLFSK